MADNFRLRLCRATKTILFLSCRFPTFTQEFITNYIETSETSKEELDAYNRNSAYAGRGKAALVVLVYLAYAIKNIYMTYATFELFDYEHPIDNFHSCLIVDDNIQLENSNNNNWKPLDQQQGNRCHGIEGGEKWQSSSIASVACLMTNCTRLSVARNIESNPSIYHWNDRHSRTNELDQLAEDVGRLPLLRLCRPQLDKIYTPITKLDAFGLLCFFASSFNVFLLGAWLTIQHLIYPARDFMIMFLVAPRATSELMRRRAFDLCTDLSISFHNYRLDSIWKFASPNFDRYFDYKSIANHNESNACKLPVVIRRRRKNVGEFAEESGHQIGRKNYNSIKRESCFKGGKSNAQIDTMVKDCLPVIRTTWWREQMLITFQQTLYVSLLSMTTVIIGAFAYVQYRIEKKKSLLSEFEESMRTMSCALWFNETDMTGVDNKHLQLVQVGQSDLTWSLYAMFETFLLNACPALSVAMLFTYYYAFLCDLSAWLAELRMYSLASLAVCRYKLSSRDYNWAAVAESSDSSDTNDESDNCESDDNYDNEENNDENNTENNDNDNENDIENNDDYFRASECYKHLDNHNERLPSGHDFAGTIQHIPQSILVLDDRDRERRFVADTRNFFRMQHLKRRFSNETCFVWLFLVSKLNSWQAQLYGATSSCVRRNQLHLINSNVVDKCRYNEYVRIILRPAKCHAAEVRQQRHASRLSRRRSTAAPSGVNRDFSGDIETLEQIYINFRLFIEHIRSVTPAIAVVISIVYLLNYGVVLIAVICSRKMSTIATESLFLIVSGWLISNFIIFFAANFHANAKKLQPLIWSLIAQLTHSKHVRVRHLRSLWLKQVQLLDIEDGLALNAFKIRITYVNIIQLIIWTATILMISYKSH